MAGIQPVHAPTLEPQRRRQEAAETAGRGTRVFRVEHKGVVTESIFDPQAFAELAGWPWLTELKEQLRSPWRFERTALFRLHAERRYLPADFPTREGERPITHDQCPHGMLTQQAPEALFEQFKREAAARLGARPRISVTQRSVVSLRTTAPCFVLDRTVPLPQGLADSGHVREFAHLHALFRPEWGWSAKQGGGGGSQHTTLAPQDAQMLIERGWAEWHPVSTAGHPLVMAYAPRDATEMELCLQVLEAAASFMLSASVREVGDEGDVGCTKFCRAFSR